MSFVNSCLYYLSIIEKIEKKKGYAIKDNTIIINRDLTELDLFVKKFIDILKKHSDYLIVRGYVSICTGRTRGTEDVDVIVPLMPEIQFTNMFDNLQKNGFWYYQGDTIRETYPYLKDFNSIRFALVDEMFPNIELIPFDDTKKAKSFEFNHPQNIRVENFEFKIPPIEFGILYKEMILNREKDIADAKHLRTFFAELVKPEKFQAYETILKKELR